MSSANVPMATAAISSVNASFVVSGAQIFSRSLKSGLGVIGHRRPHLTRGGGRVGDVTRGGRTGGGDTWRTHLPAGDLSSFMSSK